jgi:hypothetical protein
MHARKLTREHVLRDEQRCWKDRPEVQLCSRLLVSLPADVHGLLRFRPNQQVGVSPAARLGPLPDGCNGVGACTPRSPESESRSEAACEGPARPGLDKRYAQPERCSQLLPSPWIRYELPSCRKHTRSAAISIANERAAAASGSAAADTVVRTDGPPMKPCGSSTEVALASGGPLHRSGGVVPAPPISQSASPADPPHTTHGRRRTEGRHYYSLPLLPAAQREENGPTGLDPRCIEADSELGVVREGNSMRLVTTAAVLWSEAAAHSAIHTLGFPPTGPMCWRDVGVQIYVPL